MSDPFVGEIRMFAGDYAPPDWALCQGQMLRSSEFYELYSLLGHTYGGKNESEFALPDLRGRVPIHQGSGSGLSVRTIGESGGEESVKLTVGQLPEHGHLIVAAKTPPTQATPSSQLTLAQSPSGALGYLPPDKAAKAVQTLNEASIGRAGERKPHANLMPSLTVNFIIALRGAFPAPP